VHAATLGLGAATRPTEPVRALLKIVASNPKSAMEALHAE
jgi:hypothetical protein